MITVYLSVAQNCEEVANYYAEVFGAEKPMIMRYSEMPAQDQEEMGDVDPDFIVHANVETFAGNLMLSESLPDENVQPNGAVTISVSHSDEALITRTFERLVKDGRVIMPLGHAFFSPLFGNLVDKYGYHWMLMTEGEL